MTADRLAALARQTGASERRTAQPREAFERLLTCTCCGTLVAVFEASNHGTHEHLDASGYVCGSCLLGDAA